MLTHSSSEQTQAVGVNAVCDYDADVCKCQPDSIPIRIREQSPTGAPGGQDPSKGTSYT